MKSTLLRALGLLGGLFKRETVNTIAPKIRAAQAVPEATVYLRPVQDEQRPEIIRGSEVMDDRANGKWRESA